LKWTETPPGSPQPDLSYQKSEGGEDRGGIVAIQVTQPKQGANMLHREAKHLSSRGEEGAPKNADRTAD